jgi:hypothetical protein
MTTIAPQSVRKHLLEIKDIFDTVQNMNNNQLYFYLCQQEHNYVLDGADNFASIVNRLHPKIYASDKKIRRAFEELFCPYCSNPLASEAANSLRILIQRCPQSS